MKAPAATGLIKETTRSGPEPKTPQPVVAVDANPAVKTRVTGTELYARELIIRLPRLEPEIEWRLYSSRPARLGVDLTILPFPRLWSQARLPLELAARPPALFFAPSHVVPFACPAPALTVIHDLAFERFPSAYGDAERAYLRLTTRWAIRRCPRLLAVSKATAQDLTRLYQVPSDRIVVVHPGGGEAPVEVQRADDDDAVLARYGIHPPFVLQVGRIEPRKNQATSLAAVSAVPGLSLVSIGAPRERALAERLTASPACRVLGHVSDADREALYRRAMGLIFPSLYEGFGFPVLEAMARGVPVVASRTSSVPEVGGEAVLWVDEPNDTAAFAAQLRRLLDEPGLASGLAERGRQRAAQFSWDACARGVLEVIRELVPVAALSPPPAGRGRGRSRSPRRTVPRRL